MQQLIANNCSNSEQTYWLNFSKNQPALHDVSSETMLHVLTFLSLQIPRDPERRSVVLVVYLYDVHGPAVGRCWRHVDAEVEFGVGIDGGHQPLGRRCDKNDIDIRLRAKLIEIKLPYFTLLVFIAIQRHDMNILQITQNMYAAMYMYSPIKNCSHGKVDPYHWIEGITGCVVRFQRFNKWR